MGLTAEIGGFIAGIGACGVPQGARAIAGSGFADCLAVLIAGWDQPACRIVRSCLDPSGASWRPFGTDRLTSADTALVHSMAAHVLDYDDTGLGGHPSAVLVPAILAEGVESLADGTALVNAYVAGYEVWAELAAREPDSLHKKGWHPSAIYGCPAAAAAGAVLRGLDASRATHAVGIAVSLTGGIVANFGSMTKPYQLGRAAQSGLIAARLAERGLTASADAIEHDLGWLTAVSPGGRTDRSAPARLGEDWAILREGLNVKLYPVCYAMHRSLDAIREVLSRHRVAPDHVASITVEIGETQAALLRNHCPQNALDAKFSVEFGMAATLISGRCAREELTDAFVQRSDVQQVMKRVVIEPISRAATDRGPNSAFDRVTLRLADGGNLRSSAVTHPLGHYRNPAPKDALAQKFRDCTVPPLTESQAEDLFQRLLAIQQACSVRDLLRSLP